ncbi:MAG: 16S rRNA (cytosine(1402)-N(4))-methyltransferase RsmH [Acidobacteriaceae bacterium]|jgi:16S rRNA (cytosine1402-N4)-methyltransferase|nr:16S rRNA (cytosine(1402)-N(4))-methyltransferase RsmH [Acidobacteriaceae bacterium]
MSAHISVLAAESLAYLRPERGGLFVDCTLGLGGHTAALLGAGATRVVGIDRDTVALEEAGQRLSLYGDRVDLVHADYRSIDEVLDARHIGAVDGALADLGVSSMQLDAPGRGFSFQRDEPLDMRMDRSSGRPVSALVAEASEEELADVIYQFGEERFSRRIARAIVRARHESPIETTGHLASIVRGSVPRRGYVRIDPATRTFQALRIWVNRELDGLDRFIESLVRRLAIGARVVIISFHSLEDRLVKHTFRALEQSTALIKVLTKKPVMAGEDEVAANPRARSAKLRAAERVA